MWGNSARFISTILAFWSNSVEEHVEHVQLILEKLREAGISASIKKSVLFADEIYFLGHTISSRGVEPAETKVDSILATRTPQISRNSWASSTIYWPVPSWTFRMVD